MCTQRKFGQIKGTPLIKMQTSDIIEIIQAGSFRMNSLRYYREQYNRSLDKVIGDPNEGKLIIHEATMIIPEEGIVQPINDIAFPTANENDFIFCMFGIGSYSDKFMFNDEQKQKLFETYDTALLITDFEEFRLRIYEAARAKGLEITDRFVQYYDPLVDDVSRLVSLLQNRIESIAFHKTIDYKYQQEYRFTTHNTTGEDYMDLDIHNISDISKIITKSEIPYLLIESHK